MTTQEVQIVKQSWKIFRAIDPVLVGDLFYSKLFADNPSLRKMFPKNMEGQYLKLLDMLTAIVMRLDNINELSSDMAAMGQRHVRYGVKPAHYTLVGNALLWTLEKGLGKDWNKEVEAAWTTCYTILADAMMNAPAEKNES